MSITIESTFNVFCNTCGNSLEASVIFNDINVDPCETCLEQAKEDVFNDSHLLNQEPGERNEET